MSIGLEFVPLEDREIKDSEVLNEYATKYDSDEWNDAVVALDDNDYNKGFRASVLNGIASRIKTLEGILNNHGDLTDYIISNTEPTGNKLFWYQRIKKYIDILKNGVWNIHRKNDQTDFTLYSSGETYNGRLTINSGSTASEIKKISFDSNQNLYEPIINGSLVCNNTIYEYLPDDQMDYLIGVVFKNNIYVFYGYGSTSYYSKCACYNGYSWSSVELPFVFDNGVAVVHDDYLHVLASYKKTSSSTTYSTKHYKWDGYGNWELVSDADFLDVHNSCAVSFNNSIYAFARSGIYKWNDSINNWSIVVEPSSSGYTYYDGMRAVVYDNKIHWFGGASSSYLNRNKKHWSMGYDENIFEYDSTIGLVYGNAIVYNNQIYLIGVGQSLTSSTTYISIFDVEQDFVTSEQSQIYSYGSASVVYKNKLYVIGSSGSSFQSKYNDRIYYSDSTGIDLSWERPVQKIRLSLYLKRIIDNEESNILISSYENRAGTFDISETLDQTYLTTSDDNNSQIYLQAENRFEDIVYTSQQNYDISIICNISQISADLFDENTNISESYITPSSPTYINYTTWLPPQNISDHIDNPIEEEEEVIGHEDHTGSSGDSEETHTGSGEESHQSTENPNLTYVKDYENDLFYQFINGNLDDESDNPLSDDDDEIIEDEEVYEGDGLTSSINNISNSNQTSDSDNDEEIIEEEEVIANENKSNNDYMFDENGNLLPEFGGGSEIDEDETIEDDEVVIGSESHA